MTLQYDNIKSRLNELDIKVINSPEEFQETRIFCLECPKGHKTEQKNTSLINRFSQFLSDRCSNMCGTCCNIDGILTKILPLMKEKGFELIELKDDHLNLVYKCICGHEATSNTKNIKKTRCCAKCQNHFKNYSAMCEKALVNDLEVIMTFKEYLENHDKIRFRHGVCGNEFSKDFAKNMNPMCTNCEETSKQDMPHGYRCVQEGCPYYAIYLGSQRPMYCDAHYPDDGNKSLFVGYHKLKKRTCIAPECTVQATYNYEDGMRQIFCKAHKQPEMVNVNSSKCIDCKAKTARYNYKKDYPKPRYCRSCREKKDDRTDMVDCCEKLCDPPNCWRQASFGYNHLNKKERRCKEHKKEDMVDIKNIHNLCKFQGCGSQANYGFFDKKATHCKNHKELGMIDIYHKRCQFEGCNVRASFNFIQHDQKPLFCVEHKEQNMVDVISSRCPECVKKGIVKQGFYNYKNESVGIYCIDHSKDGMVDVRNNKCCECDSFAFYGFLGKSPTSCRIHMKDGMMKYPNKICSVKACREKATHGYIGTFPIYCELHHDKENHCNLIEQKCIKCNLSYILDENDLCLYCSPIKKSEYLTKQRTIKDFLDLNTYKIDSYDKKLKDGCGKERPDFVFECAGYFLILEVDEYQHSHYNVECEHTRMINISQSLGMPTIFLRYNPDRFTMKNKVMDVPKKKRLEQLKEILDTYLHVDLNLLNNFCSVVYLFYNDYDVNDRKCILPFD